MSDSTQLERPEEMARVEYDFRTIEEMLKVSRYELFWPTDRNDLFMDYPELQKIPQIKAIEGKPKELLFVWFYACKSSPAMKLHTDRGRRKLALEATFPEGIKDPYSRWIDVIPQHIAEAAAALRCAEIGPRTRERMIAERNMRNAIQLVDIDVRTLNGLDWNEKKNYLMAVEKSQDIVAKSRSVIEGLSGVVLVEDEQPEGHELAKLRRITTEPL